MSSSADRPPSGAGTPPSGSGSRPEESARRHGAAVADGTVAPAGSATAGDRGAPEEQQAGVPLTHRETVRLDVSGGNLAHRPTVRLPTQRPPAASGGRAPLPVAVVVATLWAAACSALPVVLVMALAQFAEGSGSLGGAAAAGAAAWLLGHGVPLGTGLGRLGLVPMALTALAAWRLFRAGIHVTRAMGARKRGSLRDAVLAAAMVGGAYGLLGGLVAMAVDGPTLAAPPVRAALTLAGFAALAALAGALRCTGSVVVLAVRTPPMLRHGVRTGVVAALLLLAVGAGFLGLSVATGGREAAEMIGAYQTGVVGQAGITLVSVAYLPNGAVWAVSYLLGPGFLIGADTAVRLTEVRLGPLPALPVLAGLPEGPVGGVGAALLAVPVLVAILAGALLGRRMLRPRPPAAATASGAPPSWWRLLGAAAVAGPVAGVLLGALAALSGGPLGDGRLAVVGPVSWQVATVGAAVVAVGAMVGAASARLLGPRRG